MFLASVDGAVTPVGRGAHPRHGRGAAARRRRLRGRAPVRRAAVRLARPPRAARAHAAQGLRLPVDIAAVDAEALALLEQAGEEEALLRLVVTRGGRRIAHGRAAARAPADRARDDRDLRADARAERPQDALLRGQHAGRPARARGRASTRRCSSRPTGGCWKGRRGRSSGSRTARLRTPPLADGILDSITRGRLLEELDVEEAPCTLDDVRAADEAFIASSVREVMPIAVVDDIELPAAPGPVTSAAHQAFTQRVVRELAAERTAA